MTHHIGSGTVNISVNLLREERDTLGRLACLRDLSLGRIIRELIALGLQRQDPQAAAALPWASPRPGESWRIRQDLNLQPFDPKSNALSN